MSRPQAASARAAGGTDRAIRSLAGVTVGGLAGIAGAISYSNMRVLAESNGQVGRHAHAFPRSVDGVEIIASLVLLADRRIGRRSGWLPWTALAIGTAASLAANVATAGPTAISRIIADWPAFALLIAVKLLSGMLEHRDADHPAIAVPGTGPAACGPGTAGDGDGDGDDATAGDGDDGSSPPSPALAVADYAPTADPVRVPARPAIPARATNTTASRLGKAAAADVTPAPSASAGTGTGTIPVPDIAALLPAKRLHVLHSTGAIHPEPITAFPGEQPALLAKAFDLAFSNGLTLQALADELVWKRSRVRTLLSQADQRPILRIAT